VCLAPERVYVERPISNTFVAALKARGGTRPGLLGCPTKDQGDELGPLIPGQPREKVLSPYYELAKKEGAKVVSERSSRSSATRATKGLDPADDLPERVPRPRAREARKFSSPCEHLAPFERRKRRAMANDNCLWPRSTVWTTNLERATGSMEEMEKEVGISWRKRTWFLRDLPHALCGGAKLSGIGREGACTRQFLFRRRPNLHQTVSAAPPCC